jgi:hypothetical protein
LGKDIRRGHDRRRGYDQPPEFEGEDRRRMAGDMAYDRSPQSEFEKLFGPGAAKIERW